jgi:hypothetical protein
VEQLFMPTQRAVKYRRLALAERDQDKARLLHQLAEEADRGVLVTSDWLWTKLRVSSPAPVERGSQKFS